MGSNIKYLLVFLLALVAIGCANVENQEQITGEELVVKETKISEEIAADGYDLTTYFELEDAIKGNPQFSAFYKGAKLLFASEENKQKFVAAADKYFPQFNEFCPVSLASDLKIKGKPTHYVVYQDNLYFFYSQDYAEKFTKEPEKILNEARKTWEEMETEKN